MPDKHLKPLDRLTESDRKRFYKNVPANLPPEECWPWKGTINGHKYGVLGFSKGNHLMAHRVAFTLYHGRDPGRFHVCHTCDNPPCCNPNHLFLGSHADNMRDMALKGRASGARGEYNWKCKLNASKVLEIRSMASRGVTQMAIAQRFGVHWTTVGRIIRRTNWGHI